jgi:hypothetical protein
MCYWFAASMIAWALLSLVGLYWRPLGRTAASTCLLAAWYRLCCELDEESNFSLRHYGAALADSRHGVPALRRVDL